MTSWTENQVVDKLDLGWVLFGDSGSEVPFGLLDPSDLIGGSVPTIPAGLVQSLFSKGLLDPDSSPGRLIKYRKRKSG